jgi:hypothetical protein
MRLLPLLPALLIAAPATASDAPDPARLKATVEKLVSFGTRHSLSSDSDPVRGIGAARRWAAGQLSALGDACDCIEPAMIARSYTVARAPNGVNIVDMIGIQKGSDPTRVVIVGAHIDSRVSDPMDATSDAPGANDDGSGVALVLEAARILSQEHFRATIVYAIFSGEEQALLGGQLLADTAKERGWTVSAMLNNDIVGNTIGTDGRRVTDRVRVFSEGIRNAESLDQAKARRSDGGEDDGPSRALAKAVDHVAAGIPHGLDVFIVRRPDRFMRGGDHEPFLDAGFPAVRFTNGIENYDAEHQTLRTENGRVYGDTIDRMDFGYLAKVAAINVATIRRLASAPAAPTSVTLEGALASDTKVSWSAVPGADRYRVYWRRADAQDWTAHRDVTGTEAKLDGVIVDDNFVGVAALAPDGAESIVTFGGQARK